MASSILKKCVPFLSSHSVQVARGMPAAAEGVLAVIGPHSHVVSAVRGASSGPLASDSVKAALSMLGTSNSSVSTFVPTEDKPVQVELHSLPTACARHNTPTQSHAVYATLKKMFGGSLAKHVVLAVPDEHVLASVAAAARAFPAYSHKSSEAEAGSAAVTVYLPASATDEDVGRHQVMADSVRLAAALVDMPCSELNTATFTDVAKHVAEETGASFKCISGTDLRDGGFGGLWGVGKAAEHLPALAILEWAPEGTADKEAIVMAGKGIVYDTGGLSIKTKTGMPGMKRDMGGAAGALGAFRAAVLSGWAADKRVVYLGAFAENSVSAPATRPDDILTMYSGLTVEVNNTDAEGRLVLADAVAYATKHLNPRVIMDMATLTGAQGVATGVHHAALYCNDDELEGLAVRVGKETGDLTLPGPYVPEFLFPEFKSAVADMKNSAKNRSNGGSAAAGEFIGRHLRGWRDTGKWLHIDMAYPAHVGERATGYGVALLSQLVAQL